MGPMKVSKETYSWGASALLPFTNDNFTLNTSPITYTTLNSPTFPQGCHTKHGLFNVE